MHASDCEQDSLLKSHRPDLLRYVRVHACMQLYIHIHTYIHVCRYATTNTKGTTGDGHRMANLYIYIYIYTHTHTYIYIHTHIHTHIHAHTHIHTYSHIYTYIHTYMYADTQLPTQRAPQATATRWPSLWVLKRSI